MTENRKLPIVWMLEVNGFLMDIQYAPRELYEVEIGGGRLTLNVSSAPIPDMEKSEIQ
jgi:hypothetical protein